MKTLLASLRYPLIQAPMAGVQNAALTIAASRAGGLGSLPAAMLDSGQLAAELDKIQTALHLQNLPYNVNF
ncbi:MAG: nitronate monooxygenase, partial [Neisseria sp.]|nr:nitronate monooxygenase [Neisseria sp.]